MPEYDTIGELNQSGALACLGGPDLSTMVIEGKNQGFIQVFVCYDICGVAADRN